MFFYILFVFSSFTPFQKFSYYNLTFHKGILCRKKHRKKQEDFAEEWNARYGGEYESAVKQTDVLLRARADYITERQAVLEFLPPDYRDGVAVTYMAKLVRDERASDLKEALSAYDEQAHRWKLEGALKTPKARREYVIKSLNELK